MHSILEQKGSGDALVMHYAFLEGSIIFEFQGQPQEIVLLPMK